MFQSYRRAQRLFLLRTHAVITINATLTRRVMFLRRYDSSEQVSNCQREDPIWHVCPNLAAPMERGQVQSVLPRSIGGAIGAE